MYTKLDYFGNSLPDSALSWAMVKDNVTGLIWEGKTDDGSIHDKNSKYNWKDAQNFFIKGLNSIKFGEFNDWRLPTIKELFSIVDPSKFNPAINVAYFPNCVSSAYWSATTYYATFFFAWYVGFCYGYVLFDDKSRAYHVSAVRNEQ